MRIFEKISNFVLLNNKKMIFGMKKVVTFVLAAMTSIAAFAQPQVIAHRGYHAIDGSCRNSLEALKQAQKLGLYGSECDINLTKDGVIVVAHGGLHPDKIYRKGENIKRLDIQRSTYEELKAIKLENGETLPTLDQYLKQLKKSKKTKLIIEVKSHYTKEKESEIVRRTIEMVDSYGLNDMVEYIAFRQHVCDELVKYGPKGIKVAYLNGTLTPEYCKDLGYTGIDYNIGVMQKNPDWVKQSQALGLTVNVWTVNDTERIQWCIDQKVDYITTDNPEEVKRLLGK